MTLKSYKIHRDLSYAFYQRFYPSLDPDELGYFSDKKIDFGLSILKLGVRSISAGYGSQGIALRLLVNKFIFDVLRIKSSLSQVFP